MDAGVIVVMGLQFIPPRVLDPGGLVLDCSALPAFVRRPPMRGVDVNEEATEDGDGRRWDGQN
eukprot:11270497-Karenia_brevis.AAC.1